MDYQLLNKRLPVLLLEVVVHNLLEDKVVVLVVIMVLYLQVLIILVLITT